MDPISLIISALVAGAAAGLAETAGSAVKDAYAGLRSLLRRRLAGNRKAEARLEELERRPDADAGPLADHLRMVGADRDRELVEAARAVLQRVDPDGARAGRYDVRISGGKGIVVGDQATVTMNFDERD